MTDEEFDALWTSCEWRQEIDRLRASLAEALEVGSHLMTAPAYERARQLLVPNAQGEPRP